MKSDINRLELVWPGKYDEEGNLTAIAPGPLPFQVVERVNETKASRESREASAATLFDVWESDNQNGPTTQNWKNKLIWGDNLLIAQSLLDSFSGKVKLIYIDPPFAVGSDFKIKVEIGDEAILKEASLIEEVAYRDTWGNGLVSYLEMLYSRLLSIRKLLAKDGSLFLHCDYRTAGITRMVLDEIFGESCFRNEIIWGYRGGGVPTNAFARKHDSIFYYAMSEESTFNVQYTPYSEATQNLINSRGGTSIDGKVRDLERGAHMPDWWADINSLQTFSPERVAYPTQKPEALLERIIKCATNENDLVMDLFCGSGTTLVVAEKLNRKWIGADLGRFAIHTSRKRLLDISKGKPFEILNLGFYERQYWSNISFGEDLDGDGKVNLLEYIAFVLKLYGGTVHPGGTHLHGKKGKAFVHVGSVSSPVTIREIEDCILEASKLKAHELHVLGWEWEMGLIKTLDNFATASGIKLLGFQIPREIMEAEASTKKNIKFFELSFIEVELSPNKEGEYFCQLIDFMIPNSELVPLEVRKKISKWSDYIDYWAVDWDFKNDTFMPNWMDYRNKNDRNLKLKSSPEKIERKGLHKVMIKVVDIFGNDTTKVIDLQVK